MKVRGTGEAGWAVRRMTGERTTSVTGGPCDGPWGVDSYPGGVRYDRLVAIHNEGLARAGANKGEFHRVLVPGGSFRDPSGQIRFLLRLLPPASKLRYGLRGERVLILLRERFPCDLCHGRFDSQSSKAHGPDVYPAM